MEKFSSEYIQH